MKRLHFLAAVLVMLASARADLTISLTPSVQNSARGREIVFSGTLTNTSQTAKLYLNDIAAVVNTGPAAELPFKANSFFWNVPGVLLPGESYTNSELFRVALKSTAPASDYRGAVTIRGGGDMAANIDLASTNFAVLSPALDIQAVDATASEFGLNPGLFKITRSGGTDIDLPVAFAVTGTAVNGMDYETVLSPVTISAGSSFAFVGVGPIPNNIAQGDRTVQLTLTSSIASNLTLASGAQVIIEDKPADAWRFAHFGANANDPAAADAADWDRDGLFNLLEFALGSDPKNGGTQQLPAAVRSGDYLMFAFSQNASATDVAFVVEGSPDLMSWSTATAEFLPLLSPQNQRTYRYKDPISATEAGFLRLRVERTDL